MQFLIRTLTLVALVPFIMFYFRDVKKFPYIYWVKERKTKKSVGISKNVLILDHGIFKMN